MGNKLYVGNLSYQTDEGGLKAAFESAQIGTVQNVTIVQDRETGRSRGFGFVEMGSAEEAEAAIKEFDGKDLDGRSLRVSEARERQPRSNFRGGGRGRGGDRY